MIYLEGAEDTENSLASLLAIHLVSQVLDEAYIIAREAKDSGEPWRYLSMLKTLKEASLAETDEDDSYALSKGDKNENNAKQYAHVVATSTPQKDSDGNKKPKTEGNLIGQGDEDLELPQTDQSQVTSTRMSNIFDMSEVISVDVADDSIHDFYDQPLTNDIITAVSAIMDSYVDKACKIVASKKSSHAEDLNDITEVNQEDYNDYSFLVDVFGSDLTNNVAFYLDDISASNETKLNEDPKSLVDHGDDNCDDENKSAPPEDDQLHLRWPTMNNTAMYNIDAYLTLNRDYEQGSDDDADPILQDPKGLSMHEITLLTANSSLQDLSRRSDVGQKPKELIDAATSDISESIASVKKSLGRRCRLQGARILACLRGWWRRTPSKRKESRVPPFLREGCPLSPEERRRRSTTLNASAMESHRVPEWSSEAWKLNTVSEALLNVSQWRDYVYTTLKADGRMTDPDEID